jgi:hypothetical protein
MTTVKRTNPSAPMPKVLPEGVTQHSEDGAVVVTDSKGRKLRIKEPNIVQESRLARLMGDSSTNIGYMLGYVQPAVMVIAIDDDRLPFPGNQLQLEAAIGLLGREGLAAVMAYMTERAEAQKDEAETLKKSLEPQDSARPVGS